MRNDSFLTGKKVLLTREERDNKEFADLIIRAGGDPLLIPMIGFRPSHLDKVAIDKLANVTDYDWIIFTSKNGVEHFFRQIAETSLLPKIAVIGRKTEKVLRSYGHAQQFVPSQFVAECFVEEFIPLLHKESKVLIVKGNLARNIIAKRIQENGHICDEVILYENVMPEESEEKLCEAIKNEQIDVITFTSSSAVEHLMKVVEKYSLQSYLSLCVIACIGPIAKQTAQAYGLQVHICAEPYTIEGLVAGLMAYQNDK